MSYPPSVSESTPLLGAPPMGAEQFEIISIGKDPRAAFDEAIRRAAYDHGHSGYTGTIAEKESYTLIPLHTATELDKARAIEHDQSADTSTASLASVLAARLLAAIDHRVSSKWGPCGCIPLGDHQYLFFGWASS